MKIVFLAFSLKLYAQWTESKIIHYFINFKSTFKNPNDFFQMIYEVIKFDLTEKPKVLPDIIRPGLFVNMQTGRGHKSITK